MDQHARDALVFKAFCDEKRLSILALLRQGEQCVCVLNESLGLAQSTLSYHLKILVESGIVASRQEGKWTYYRLCEQGSQAAQALLSQLTRLETPAEATLCATT